MYTYVYIYYTSHMCTDVCIILIRKCIYVPLYHAKKRGLPNSIVLDSGLSGPNNGTSWCNKDVISRMKHQNMFDRFSNSLAIHAYKLEEHRTLGRNLCLSVLEWYQSS